MLLETLTVRFAAVVSNTASGWSWRLPPVRRGINCSHGECARRADDARAGSFVQYGVPRLVPSRAQFGFRCATTRAARCVAFDAGPRRR